jgi:dodecin
MPVPLVNLHYDFWKGVVNFNAHQTINAMSVYKVIEVIGSSEKSWEEAARIAVERASQTLDDLRIAEVVSQDVKIENGKITAFRTKLSLSFKFREE